MFHKYLVNRYKEKKMLYLHIEGRLEVVQGMIWKERILEGIHNQACKGRQVR